MSLYRTTVYLSKSQLEYLDSKKANDEAFTASSLLRGLLTEYIAFSNDQEIIHNGK